MTPNQRLLDSGWQMQLKTSCTLVHSAPCKHRTALGNPPLRLKPSLRGSVLGLPILDHALLMIILHVLQATALDEVLVDPVTSAIYHIEKRPSEGGRNVLVNTKTGLDVVGREWNVRSRVHEYGGAPDTSSRYDLCVLKKKTRCCGYCLQRSSLFLSLCRWARVPNDRGSRKSSAYHSW